MPIRTAQASTSRRTARDDRPTPSADTDEDEEDFPRKKGKGKTRAVAAATGNGRNGDGGDRDEDEDDEMAGRWTIDTYKPRPVRNTAQVQSAFRSAIDTMKNLQSRISDALEKTKEVAIKVEEAREDDELVIEIEAGFLRGLEQIHNLQIKIDVMDGLAERVKRGEGIVDPHSIFKAESEEQLNAWMAKSKRAKFKASEEYKEFRNAIWQIHHPSQGCPPVSRWLPKGDDDSDNSDIEMGGTTQRIRCPITLQPYVNACTNTTCGHTYSREAIEGLIRQASKRAAGGRNARATCPQAGCSEMVELQNLRDDPKVQKIADEQTRREKQREEEEEDDAVDVLDDD